MASMATPPTVLSKEARTEREKFPSSRYSIMIDHTKNAAGKSAQKIPISTALELLPDCRIAQIAVTVSRTAVVKDAMTTNTMRLKKGIIGVLRVRRQLLIWSPRKARAVYWVHHADVWPRFGKYLRCGWADFGGGVHGDWMRGASRILE
jgi:hypothetical protein